MSIEEEVFEKFYKDYIANKSCENIEIEWFYVKRSLFDYINGNRDFDLAYSDEYEQGDGFKGWFEDIPLHQNTYIDGHYDIKSKTLWEICTECQNEKMYDGKNKVHYCPICDNRRTRFKDKLFNVLR